MTVSTFSPDLPHLLIRHLDHLMASAINIDTIRARGYKTVMGKTDLQKAGFSKAQQRYPGILMPIHGVQGKVAGYQYRPDSPRMDNARQRAIKYENPRGSSVQLDVPPACLKALGDPDRPAWFTEGIKKVDALASAGVCAIGLTGVWGFKGKNPMGGTTILADFDCITLKDRTCYLVFDSDYTTNPQVRQALNRLAEHLKRKGGKVHILHLPKGEEGAKLGIDDYLATGKTLEDAKKLEVEQASPAPSFRQRTGDLYCIEANRICIVRQTKEGELVEPLCNFTAQITDIITRDNGIDITKAFNIDGSDELGQPLPTVEVTSANFDSMSWVTKEWDTKAFVFAKQTAKDNLRVAMMLASRDAARRVIYAHTGWRNVNGNMVFLTSSGALGGEGVEVELEDDFRHYSLPAPVEDPAEALRTSMDFIKIGTERVTLPLWAAMYLAPLSEILDPAFTLFMVGHSGSYKSTISALALAHYGEKFDELHLPAAWRDTENKLEKLLFLAKDLPLIIDDWAPGQDSAKARELEAKAEHVIRAQGNRQGKGRLRSDTSSRRTYIPRGLLLTSGEQLPSGHSHTARIFSVEIEAGDIDMEAMSAAQRSKHQYSQAMTQYILWLKGRWPELEERLPEQHKLWRDQARTEGCHPRLPATVSWLYAGLAMALEFMVAGGAATEREAEDLAKKGWDLFIQLSTEQSSRVEEERPGKRFMEVFRSLLTQGRAVVWSKDDDAPRKPVPGETMVGWDDMNGSYLLEPSSVYAAVHEFCGRSGSPFTFKQDAVWKDLKRMGLTDCNDGYRFQARIYGERKRVVKLKKSCVHLERTNANERENPTLL